MAPRVMFPNINSFYLLFGQYNIVYKEESRAIQYKCKTPKDMLLKLQIEMMHHRPFHHNHSNTSPVFSLSCRTAVFVLSFLLLS